MTPSSSRDGRTAARPVVRLVRAVLALTLAFLTVPFLTLSPAYAEDAAATSAETSVTEVVEPPPDQEVEQPPAEEPAAQEPALTTEEPKDDAAPAPEPEPEAAAGSAVQSTQSTETTQGKQKTSAKSAPVELDLPAPDCTVTDFTQNTAEGGGGDWINGALNQNNSNYAEGDLVPQKIDLKGLVPGVYTIGFTFDRTKNGLYAYDYVTGLSIDGSAGATASWTSSTGDFDGPAPVGAATGTTTVSVTITFTITALLDQTAVIGWDGHIASELDYGPDSGAGTIDGAPYHFSVVGTGGLFGCDSGKRDNQLMADAVDAGEITIVKDAQPNAAQDFHFTLAAPNNLNAAFDLDDDGDATLPTSVTYRVPPGTTTAAEVNIPDGWSLTDITCTKAATETATSASVVLADNESVTCTFTNSRTSTLEVDKMWVINGGTPVAEGSEPAHLGLGAQLTVDGNNEPWNTALDGYLQGTTVTLDETVTFGNDLCTWADSAEQGRVTEVNGATTDAALPHDVALGGGANHATITNEVTCAAELVLRKVVVNENGGTATADDWTLHAGDHAVSTGTTVFVDPTTPLDLSESGGPAGYTLEGIVCDGVETTAVQVAAGDAVTCTFTNVDSPGRLILDKIVDPNATRDTTEPSAWHLSGTPDGIEGQGVVEGDGHADGAVKAGTYTLAEDGPAGFTAGEWTCEGPDGAVPVSENDTIELAAIETVSCEITNTAIQPTLTLIRVQPGETGDETPASAWTLSATPDGIEGQPALTGAGGATSIVKVGDYVLTETGPTSYEMDPAGWACVDAADEPVEVDGSTVTVGLADDITCTIINRAIPSEWMVAKSSSPPTGATVEPGEQIDYTVTLTKVGDGVPVEGITVTDTLTGIEDAWVSGLDAGATISGGVITWSVAELGDEPLTLTYTVTVGEGAWNRTIENQVTPGPVPCVDTDEVDCDFTEHFTPHYTLDKAVALLATPGDDDGIAEPGERLRYTLTVVNDSDAVVDTVITDDVSDVLDNAAVVSLGDGLSLDGDELSWTIAGLEPGEEISVSYVVQIDAGAWDQTLHNVATPNPDDGGECIPPADATECETTTETPPVTTMVVEKHDLETDEVLADATFELWSLGPVPEGGCDFPAAPGEGDIRVGTATTLAGGQALFHDLQHGCYLLVEVEAPPGYELPENPVLGVQVDEANFVAGGEMAPIVINDFAEGQLAIVAKRQFERIGGAWVESDGVVDYGDTVRYVLRVAATGPRNFHDVKVTDYVPGFNPEDTQSTVDGTLVPGSAECSGGLACSVSVDPATNLVTWDIGDLEPDAGVTISGDTVMEVVFPEAPTDLDLAAGETHTDALWNVGFLEWDEAVPLSRQTAARSGGGGAGGRVASAAMVELPLVHHFLTSNEVLVRASITADAGTPPVTTPPVTAPPQGPLPQTGAPAGLGPIAAISGLLLALGLSLVRRRKE